MAGKRPTPAYRRDRAHLVAGVKASCKGTWGEDRAGDDALLIVRTVAGRLRRVADGRLSTPFRHSP